MRKLRNIIKLMMFGAVAAMALAACGGGGGGGDGATVPAAPVALTANAGNGQIPINWVPVAGATSYNVYQGTAAGITKASGTKVGSNITASTFTATGLTNSTTYFFVVTAVNAAGESNVSAEKSATPSATPPPAAPGNIRGAAGVGKATISWDTSAGATSYNIYYATSKGVTKTGIKVANAVSPQDVTLTNGTTYFFVVTAVNANGESATSFEVSVTPAATPPPTAPTGATATAGNGQVTVSWTAVAGATSYNIYYAASTGVTKGTGTKVAGAVSPRAVTGLTNNTTYFFVVTAVNANGESSESSQVSATPAAPVVANFTQADLTGTWNFIQFVSGPEVTAGTYRGWLRGNATIDSSGNVTVNSIQDSSGTVGVPPAGTMTETIDANGVVTQGGINGVGAGNHAVMAANKQLVVGIGTLGPNQVFMIFVKQVGTFSNADISSGTFAYSQLKTGANSSWQFGTGSINAAQQITLNTQLDSNGPTTLPPANFLTLAITTAGIVTNSGVNAEPTYQGVMTPDKKLIIGTENNTGGGYKLRIIAIGGQTFSTADLAGTWSDHSITSATVPVWEYKTLSITSSGVVTMLTFKDSNGNTTVSGQETLSVGPTGLITIASDPSVHGVMSFGKNFAVATATQNTGVFGMDILVK